MVSENFRRSRIDQGCHGYKGGFSGDCKEAKIKGKLLGGSNSASRTEPGKRDAWIPVEANLQIYQDWNGYKHMVEGLDALPGFDVCLRDERVSMRSSKIWPVDVILGYCYDSFTSGPGRARS